MNLPYSEFCGPSGPQSKNQQQQQQKRTGRIMDFAVPADHKVKIKESEVRQVLRIGKRTKKAVEHEGDSNTN